MNHPAEGRGGRSLTPIPGRFLTPAAWGVLVAFLGVTVVLAGVNRSPGSSDSCGNLILARSLVGGRGYVTGGLGGLWDRVPLDAPDSVRPPGLPWLLAGVFAVTGVSLAVPVLVNGAAVALNALALRWAVRHRGGRRAGDLALILTLLSYNYEMVSVWTNNILAACTSLLLLSARPRPGRRPHPFGRPAALALWSAAGFVMKPTFLLNAWPFAFLVLGADPENPRPRRAREIAVYLGLFLALTSVYWGRDIALYGEPFHSPSFASSRLAARYEFLPHGTWRTVRFDRPATYGEVVRTLGLGRMLLVDAKMMAKTVFYSVCMNPFVVLCGAGVLLFRQPSRWRDYAEVAALCAGTLFEVGVYNHHEFRYLWPMYPCFLLLAWLTVRDFAEWGQAQMTPALQSRFWASGMVLGACALLTGAFGALEHWRAAVSEARRPIPGWVAAVRRLPPSSVVLTADVGPVLWWTGRRAVVSPLGDRRDLAAVVSSYQPGYYLALGDEDLPGGGVAFAPDDLVLIEQGRGWRLYRIVGPLLEGDAASRHPPTHGERS